MRNSSISAPLQDQGTSQRLALSGVPFAVFACGVFDFSQFPTSTVPRRTLHQNSAHLPARGFDIKGFDGSRNHLSMADRGIPVSVGRIFDLHELFALDLSLAGAQKRKFTVAAYRRSFLLSSHADFSHRRSPLLGMVTVDSGSGLRFPCGLFLLHRDCHPGFQSHAAEVVARNEAHVREPGLTLQDSSAYSPFRGPTPFFASAHKVNCFAVTIRLLRTGFRSWPGEILVNA